MRDIDWGVKSSEKIEVYQEVKQGCSLSPMTFGLYLHERIKESQKSIRDNLKTNNVLLDIILFVNDQIIIKCGLYSMWQIKLYGTFCILENVKKWSERRLKEQVVSIKVTSVKGRI
jgi:hypothetical protein